MVAAVGLISSRIMMHWLVVVDRKDSQVSSKFIIFCFFKMKNRSQACSTVITGGGWWWLGWWCWIWKEGVANWCSRFPCCVFLALSWNTNENPSQIS